MANHVTSASEKIAIVIGIILYIGAFIFMAMTSDTSIYRVFIGMLPTLLYLITFFFLFKMDASTVALWVLPLAFPLLFIILWYSNAFGLLNTMDTPVVAVVNVILSYFINIFLLLILTAGTKTHKVEHTYHDTKEIGKIKHELGVVTSQLHNTATELEETKQRLLETQKVAIEAKKELIVSKENFNLTLRSIEDKCKAINFVIGRVYSEKKGAGEQVRSKLRIDSELYNSFSELTSDFKAEDAQKLYVILKHIYSRLSTLELPEKDVIKLHEAALPVDRDKHGNDAILDVLRKNDKDPILEYHSGAKEICEKLMDFLEENSPHIHP
ncbi:MAG: hypothetical protein ACP5OA_02395 [Candidatus Woesearchaeota archaeon]